MFLEITKEAYEKLKPYLAEFHVPFEVSDCTLPGEQKQMVHIEISGNYQLSPAQINSLNERIDHIYGGLINKNEKDLDGNGTPDKLEKSEEIVQVRRRTWDDKMHTPGQEAKGWFTGENEEEEISYEHR